MVKMVFPEKQVHVAFKGLKDLLASLFQVHKVQKVNKGHKVKKDLKVCLGEMENKVQRETQAQEV